MGDPTGLGKLAEGVAKLADSQVGIRAYDDLLAGAMKEGGQALVDTVKAFRLFTAPIQLLAMAQDRLTRFCEEVRQRVPEQRQVEAPASLALPVLMNLRWMEDDNLLTELYLSLLERAIDRERQNEAHPAFARIIEQMSPDEAIAMYVLRGSSVFFQLDRTSDLFHPIQRSLNLKYGNTWIGKTNFPLETLADPDRVFICLDHLASLSLVSSPQQPADYPSDSLRYHATDFGRLFIKACIPEDFALKRGTDEEREDED